MPEEKNEKCCETKKIAIPFEDKIFMTCMRIFNLLKQKNAAYGNSASDPLRIFSKASKLEQLRVRMDDKLSRIKNAKDKAEECPNRDIGSEDAFEDLLGYLVIYQSETTIYEKLKKNIYLCDLSSILNLSEDGDVGPKPIIKFLQTITETPNNKLVIFYPIEDNKFIESISKIIQSYGIKNFDMICHFTKDDPKTKIKQFSEGFNVEDIVLAITPEDAMIEAYKEANIPCCKSI